MNKKYHKILIIFLFITIFAFSLKNIYAKDLNYMATINPDDGGSGRSGYLMYNTFVKSFSGPNSSDSKPDAPANTKLYNSSGNDDLGYYKTKQLLFHTAYTSRYQVSNSYDKKNYKDNITYDQSKDDFILSHANVNGNFSIYSDHVESKIVNFNENKDPGTILETGDDENVRAFYSYAEPIGDGSYMRISAFRVTGDTYKNLYNSVKNITTITAGDSKKYKQIKVSNLLNDGNYTYKTANDFFAYARRRGYSDKNFGYSEGGKFQLVGTSALNNYDNNLYIPSAPFESKKIVRVRFVLIDKDGVRRELPQNRR